MSQQRCSKRDQSVQTCSRPSIATTILVDSHLKERTSASNTQLSTHRRRSSLKTFLSINSPKPISLINRTRRRSINLKAPKRLSSECLVSIILFC